MDDWVLSSRLDLNGGKNAFWLLHEEPCRCQMKTCSLTLPQSRIHLPLAISDCVASTTSTGTATQNRNIKNVTLKLLAQNAK